MFAYDYPLLGVFWTIMFWFLWIAWIVLLFRVIADIFRNHETGGFSKALWAIFVIVVPWLGVLVYLIAHGDGMGRRDQESMRSQEAAFQSYVKDVAGSNGPADELTKLAELKSQGVLSDAEFEAQKARVLASG